MAINIQTSEQYQGVIEEVGSIQSESVNINGESGSSKIIVNKSKGWLVPALITGNAATYTQSGFVITVTSTGHLIPATIHDGKSVYLVIGSGNATSGWFSNFTYVDANTFTCVSTISQTTNGAVNTNIAQVTVTELTTNIAAGSMGLNGSIRVNLTASVNNSAGAKTARVFFGGTGFITAQATTSLSLSAINRTISNRGVTNKQVSQTIASLNGATSTAAVTNMAIDTSADVSLTITLQAAVASDYIALESVLYELIL